MKLMEQSHRISSYLGEELKKSENLGFTPERILIEYILAETDKTYHIYGRVKKNQELGKLYWLPKTQVLDDPYFEEKDLNINFDPYNNILAEYGKKLFQHQKTGVNFLCQRNGAILADGMGLAKTMQSIIASIEVKAKKILIVCPSSVKINWEREINVFCDDTTIVSGDKWRTAKYTIINFDILKNFHTLESKKKGDLTDSITEIKRHIVNSKFDLVIIDEAHYLKNDKSIRTSIMLDVCCNYGIEKVWLLTGTPIANRPMDYFSLLSMVKSPIAENWMFFATRYCDAKRINTTLKSGKKKQVWLTKGASNLEELTQKTRSLVLRRKKEDVLDMPPKTVTPIYHELDDTARRVYDGLWDQYIEKRKEAGKRINIDKDLVELILLRKHISMEAIPHTIEIAENAIEEGHKVIIFTNFTDELMALKEHFGKKSVIHNGPMKDTEKQLSVDRYQTDDSVKVFIGNIRSAGVGITLTAGDIVIFNSYDWVPGSNEQCEDRSYRIGQLNNVTVYYQLFKDTISEKMWWTLINKSKIIEQILSDKQLTDEEIMLEMMNFVADYE
jgi:SWI/SNF-related matrix-associated actin-dependent regulator 1 of chromatin subfamily A